MYSPSEYNLQQSADGRIHLLPRENRGGINAALINGDHQVGPAQHQLHQPHQQQQHQQQQPQQQQNSTVLHQNPHQHPNPHHHAH